MKRTVSSTDNVLFHLLIRLADGSVALDTNGEEPFSLSMTDETFPKKVITALIGMSSGGKKKVDLNPDEAYGQFKDELVRKVPLENLPEDILVGQILTSPEDNRHWAVEELGEHFAVLNGNHPLAGKNMTFEIELLGIDDEDHDDGDDKDFRKGNPPGEGNA